MPTGWLDGSATPTRIGVYQRDHYGTLEFAYWSGAQWNFGCRSVLEAHRMFMPSRFQNLPWRGLTEEECATLTDQ